MDRFHKAARDGYLDALKEATRKDLNTRDEDGMTPTLWAAFEGNLDALRLIVGRGGDPDKCDNFGNTALHFASARGHLNCVTFLVNFGVNMWALDIDFHTPKDLAAINNKDEILRFLDAAVGREEAKDRKKVKAFKEKAAKDAEKRVKEFDKIQKKASKSVEKEQEKLLKVRKEMEKNGTVRMNGGGEMNPDPHRPSMAFLSLRKDSKLLYGQSPKFSEIVANQGNHQSVASKIPVVGHYTGVYKKVQQRKTMSGTKPPAAPSSDFKVADIEGDGRRSVRSLSGLRRDSEIMYVPKYEISSANNVGKRGKISGLFDEGAEDEEEANGHSDNSNSNNPDAGINSNNQYRSGGTVGKRAGSISGIGLTRSISQPDYMHQVGTDSGFNDDTALAHNTPSIFERPGFGSVAFRNSITSTLSNFPTFSQNISRQVNHKDSIGSASSLNQRSTKNGPWDEMDIPSEDEDEMEMGPVELFLAAAGLTKYIPIFMEEKIDLDALMLLSEGDLKDMGIEMGPRRKLLKSIADRQGAMERPGEVIDSRL